MLKQNPTMGNVLYRWYLDAELYWCALIQITIASCGVSFMIRAMLLQNRYHVMTNGTTILIASSSLLHIWENCGERNEK